MMIHPLFRLVFRQPSLLTDHLEAYAELVGEEVGAVTSELKKRAVLMAAGAGLGLLAVILICMALLLWTSIPTSQMPFAWGLLLIPAVPTIGAVLCFLRAKSSSKSQPFQNFKRQLAADAAMLREVSAA